MTRAQCVGIMAALGWDAAKAEAKNDENATSLAVYRADALLREAERVSPENVVSIPDSELPYFGSEL